MLMKLGMVLPMIDPTPVAPPGVSKMTETILNWMMWGGLVATIAGFIIAGIMLAISNERGMGNESVKRVGMVIIGAVVIMGAGALGNALVN